MLTAQRLPRDFQLFIVAVVLAAAVLLWLFTQVIRWQAWPELLLFVVLIAVTSMFPIPNPRAGYVTSTTTLMYVLLSVQQPISAVLVAGSAYAIGHATSRGWVPWRTFFNGAQMGISVGLAALVFRLLGGSPQAPGVTSLLVPLALASIVHQASNNFFVTFFFGKLRQTPWFRTWLIEFKDSLSSNLLTIPSAALLAILYVFVHPATLLLYLVSLPAQRWAIQLYLQQRQIYKRAIDSLVLAIDANFPQGAGHSRRVADLAAALAMKMRLPDPDVEAIELGGLLHDVGMIGLDELFDSAMLFDSPAIEKIRQHVLMGAEVAGELPRRDVSEIVMYHHENYDGSGYPRGLRGAKIPVGARIVAVAEAFESMTAGGLPYTGRLSASEAMEAVRMQSGQAFDPQIVEAFLELNTENKVTSDKRERQPMIQDAGNKLDG